MKKGLSGVENAEAIVDGKLTSLREEIALAEKVIRDFEERRVEQELADLARGGFAADTSMIWETEK